MGKEMSAIDRRKRTSPWLAVFGLAVACADPAAVPGGSEAVDQPAVADEASDERPADDPATPRVAGPDGVTAPAANDEAPDYPDYQGPRVAIDAVPSQIAPSTPIQLSARVTAPDGARLELGEEARFEWRVPEGWTLEGEGPEVTVTPPERIAADADRVDIGLTVERDGETLVRGGVLLSAGG